MKIVTALANPRLNKELAKIENIEILAPDIQYQDGVIEILDEKKSIDVLILSEVLSGSFNIKEFIILPLNLSPVDDISPPSARCCMASVGS